MQASIRNNRLENIDIAKGIGMLLVIWAHILVEGPINWFIYVFHMPLFFYISGMLYTPDKYKKVGTLVSKRARTLIVPYVIYSCITWAVWCGYAILSHQEVDSYLKPLFQTVIAQGSGGFLVHNVPLWFVTCLFVVEIAYYFINKLRDDKIKAMTCVVISGIGYCMIEVFTFFPFNLLPWSIEVACATMIYYGAGNILRSNTKCVCDKFKESKTVIRFAMIATLFLITTFCSLRTRHISYGSDGLGDRPIELYVGAFTGIALILLISALITSFSASSNVINGIISYVKWIGKYSFRFMAIHVPIKGFLTVVVAKMFSITTDVVGGSIGYSLIVFAITLGLSTIITILTNHGVRSLTNRKQK